MGNISTILGPRPVALAPMAGVTDAPFRAAVRRYGVALVYSEMVASAELLRDRRSAALTPESSTSPTAPSRSSLPAAIRHALAEAARIAEAEGAILIDINMGCPAKKVVGGLCGSALMREPELARALVRAVVAAVRVPVTVKMRTRLGRRRPQRARSRARLGRRGCASDLGPRPHTRAVLRRRSRLALHRRRQRSGLGPRARQRRRPHTAKTPCAILKDSGADGVLVGRGAFGRPWIIRQMQAAVARRRRSRPILRTRRNGKPRSTSIAPRSRTTASISAAASCASIWAGTPKRAGTTICAARSCARADPEPLLHDASPASRRRMAA